MKPVRHPSVRATGTTRFRLSAACVSTLCFSYLAASAQTHRVDKPQTVTRAVAVYEYVGDLAKPTAARLIPVSLFYGGHFEDAGTYLSRPVPLALQTDTAYDLENAGVRIATLDLAFAKNFRQNSADATSTFDDGWFGYGKIHLRPAAKPAPELAKTGKSTGHAYVVQDDGKPHFGAKPKQDNDIDTARNRRAPDPDPADPDRATKISLPDDNRDPKAPDAERPTLKRSTTDTTDGSKSKRPKETASVSQTPPSPDRDPDRPSIRRKGPGEADSAIPPDPSDLAGKSTPKAAGGPTTGTVTGAQPTLDDPNRPGLHRGKPATPPTADSTASAALDLPKFNGRIPLSDLKQTVAISDPQQRPEHDFTYHFASDTDRTAALRAMETLAAAALANPALATDAPDFVKTGSQAAAAQTAHAPTATAQTATAQTAIAQTGNHADTAKTSGPLGTPRQRGAAVRRHSAPAAPVTPSNTLADEQLTAFQLSFGAPATYVFTAHTGPAATTTSSSTTTAATPIRYVTVVAQPDTEGHLQIGLRSVTDSAHLDRTPRYRLVDAVDADASNRASLLFELRSNASRQFALYRLLGPRPDQLFETGSTK